MRNLITIYHQTDEVVLDTCSKAGLVLIGGTALEVLAKKYDVKLWRVRSENDFDYLHFSKTGKLPDIITIELASENKFEITEGEFGINLTNENTEIDILIEQDLYAKKFIVIYKGIKLLNATGQFYYKCMRYMNSKVSDERDEADLLFLLAIIDKCNQQDELEIALRKQNFDKGQEKRLNGLIVKYNCLIPQPLLPREKGRKPIV